MVLNVVGVWKLRKWNPSGEPIMQREVFKGCEDDVDRCGDPARLKFNTAFTFAGDGTPTGGFTWDGRAASLADQASGPLLNPNEMANADLKQAVTKRAPARTKLQLVKATAGHLRSVQQQPERVKSYFEHEPVRYAA